ncbi:SpoIVB peptidase S55 domain-containing protein [Bengtsoniella intestinalis]|uniref:SpoIVB peptidase S55 domain-containing protein n=1 Tax=Bengtsoniella intestinalis TaxID=3073143 RepID=UPI00391F5D31
MIGLYEKAKRLLPAVLVVCAMGITAGATSVVSQTLVPVGDTAGIELFAPGVVVVKLSEGNTPAKSAGLQTGDLIVECNGTAVTTTGEFQALMQSGDTTQLVLADETVVTVTPQDNGDGTYSIGAWIRDSMAGIGTITYYDPETGAFAALGHGITDGQLEDLMPLERGFLIPSSVASVAKGSVGTAGQLVGEYDLSTQIGTLEANTATGIYGVLNQAPTTEQTALPIASAEEIQVGSATILSNVQGDMVEEYTIEITAIRDTDDGRDMELKITDPDLIAITGGIVQGMSGSPIIQNGKLIGAVTHVLVSEPTKGYGIFIENMLSTAETVA